MTMTKPTIEATGIKTIQKQSHIWSGSGKARRRRRRRTVKAYSGRDMARR